MRVCSEVEERNSLNIREFLPTCYREECLGDNTRGRRIVSCGTRQIGDKEWNTCRCCQGNRRGSRFTGYISVNSKHKMIL